MALHYRHKSKLVPALLLHQGNFLSLLQNRKKRGSQHCSKHVTSKWAAFDYYQKEKECDQAISNSAKLLLPLHFQINLHLSLLWQPYFTETNIFPFNPNLSVSVFPQVQFLNEVFQESSFQEQILGFGYRETRADFEHSKTKPQLQSINSISILIQLDQLLHSTPGVFEHISGTVAPVTWLAWIHCTELYTRSRSELPDKPD